MTKRIFRPAHLIAASAVAFGLSASGAASAADSPAEFYKDNVLTVILGAGPGGGYDLYARTVLKHLVKHIPGKPKYIMQFMPGAGGQKAAQYFYNVASRDGAEVARAGKL